MEKNNSFNLRSKTAFKLLITIVVVAVLAISLIWLINNYNKEGQNKQNNNSVAILDNLSKSDLERDFENKEIIAKSETPASDLAIKQFQPYIDISLKSIKENKPSRPENTTLMPDYLNIAVDYMILGQYDKAEDYYKQTLKQWPEDYKANVGLGDLYILMAQYQKAALKYYEVINLYPKDANAYAKLADIYYKYSKNKAKADKIYELGISNAENKVPALDAYIVFLANYKRDTVKLEEIKKEYDKIVSGVAEQQRQQIEKSIELK